MTSTGTKKDSRGWRRQTLAVRGGQSRSNFGETSEALFLTSGYVYDAAEQAEARFKGEDDGFIYSRFSNPTVGMFEERVAAIEGMERAMATATGMAAVNASLVSQLKAGDHVVSARALFGSCRYIVDDILPRFGVDVTLVDGGDLAQWGAAVRGNTVCGFLETPSNPMLDIVDIRAVADILHGVDARLVVDNAFATPALQRPGEFGADIVVYSATKHIDGQGRCLGGVVLGSEDYVENILKPYLRHTGPALSPFNAWVMLKGLETLELRLERHCASAATIAALLEEDDRVSRVIYPWLDSHPGSALAKKQMKAGGGIITFDIGIDKDQAFRFLNGLNIVDISNNLGDSKSLITHPATTTHQRVPEAERHELGILPTTVRLSVGLEDIDDLLDDIRQALSAL
ncbi:MAG: O-succinylhomoserine sulfhydrylase [Proteobacteria bacterium]|nr:O-succinylhomoserine sulfhydrylase [Pseudomonadota bacterium]MDA1058463.1 O-succinylhomoserine sulfhydrylase [Pseudomonadota bacterium]